MKTGYFEVWTRHMKECIRVIQCQYDLYSDSFLECVIEQTKYQYHFIRIENEKQT